MRIFKYVLSATIVASTSMATAAEWNAATHFEKPAGSHAKISVVTFTKEKQTLQFTPSQMPFGLVGLDKVVFRDRNPLFLTTWANGAKTIMLRIFDPETKGNQPICEFDSVAAQSKLQIVGTKLQIQVQQKTEDALEWLDCATFANTSGSKK